MNNLSLVLDGMGCGGCVTKVRNALDALPGVAVDNVEIGSVRLAYDPVRSSPQVITDALSKAGYPAREDATTATTGQASGGGHCGI